ncbi:MAG: hypothetical protein ACREA4_03110 [Nitrososphaera sp.]
MMVYSNPGGFALNSSGAADLTWSKQYSSSGTIPLVNEYVRYDITITNSADTPIKNQALWVSFASGGGETRVHTALAVPTLEAGSSTAVHLGPFKMREAGEHHLFMGMNSDGDPTLPNEIMLNYEPTEPVDKFIVYEPTHTQIIPVAVSVVAGGAVLSALHFIKRRKTIAK